MREFTIDCQGKGMGEVVKICVIKLRGLDNLSYHPCHVLSNGMERVNIVNADRINPLYRFKKFYSHSRYAGGLKVIFVNDLLLKDPKRVFKRAILGHLPKNKSSKVMLKRVKVFKNEENVDKL